MTNPVSVDVDVVTASHMHAAGEARILDVRDSEEWQAGHITGALHIPMAELGGRLKEIDKNTVWLAICRTGSRSSRATEFLRAAGVDMRNITGGFRAWAAADLAFVDVAGNPGQVL